MFSVYKMKMYQTKNENKIKISAKSENGKSSVKYFVNGKETSFYNPVIVSLINFDKINKLEAIAQN